MLEESKCKLTFMEAEICSWGDKCEAEGLRVAKSAVIFIKICLTTCCAIMKTDKYNIVYHRDNGSDTSTAYTENAPFSRNGQFSKFDSGQWECFILICVKLIT